METNLGSATTAAKTGKELEVTIPPETVPETPYVEVKIYPGVMAQAVEGLEKILRMPHG